MEINEKKNISFIMKNEKKKKNFEQKIFFDGLLPILYCEKGNFVLQY